MRHAQQKQDSGVRSPLEKCVMAWRALAMVEIVCVCQAKECGQRGSVKRLKG